MKTYQNKINLAARLREDPVMRARGRAMWRRLAPYLAVIAVTAVFELVHLAAVRAPLAREYEALSAQIAGLQPAYGDMLIRSKQLELATQESAGLSAALDAVDSYGELSGELLAQIYRAAQELGVTIQGLEFDRYSAGLTLRCSGPKITSPTGYSAGLSALSAVESAVYGGYEKTASGAYSFEITCLLRGGERLD